MTKELSKILKEWESTINLVGYCPAFGKLMRKEIKEKGLWKEYMRVTENKKIK